MDNILSDSGFLEDFNPNYIAKNIALRLKQRRIELNLTQKELSEKSGVSFGSLKRFETKFEISLKNLLMLAVVLNSAEEFKLLFSKQQYRSIDDIVKLKPSKQRVRKSEKRK